MKGAWAAVAGLSVLPGCGASPISNEVLYADAGFLAALPSSDELAVPQALLDVPAGDSDVLVQAQTAGYALDDVLAPLVASADAVRGTPPDDRSDAYRGWDPVTVVATVGGDVRVWWVTCEIAAPEDGPTTWTMRLSAGEDGDYADVGTGWMSDTARAATWDEGAVADVLGGDGDGVLDLSVDPEGLGDDGIHVDERGPDVGSPALRSWALFPQAGGLAWNDGFAVTDDGATWPGYAVAREEDAGGRAQGQVFPGEEPLSFATCWTAEGDAVWTGGDAGVRNEGVETDCGVAAF